MYTEEKLLHRDISIGNLAYEEVDGKPRIIILDFELATRVDDEARTNEVRTGTAPFMAREVLKGFQSGYRHTLNHDLESVYYIAGWHIAGYRGYKLPTNNKQLDPCRDWRYGTYGDMCRAKEEHIDTRPSINPFKNFEKSKGDKRAIYGLNGVRGLYRERAEFVRTYVRVQKDEEDAAIKAVKRQAVKNRLSMEEKIALVNDKMEELSKENARRKPTNAISFKEWMVGAEFMVLEDIDCDCDSCNDELAKTFNPFEMDEIDE